MSFEERYHSASHTPKHHQHRLKQIFKFRIPCDSNLDVKNTETATYYWFVEWMNEQMASSIVENPLFFHPPPSLTLDIALQAETLLSIILHFQKRSKHTQFLEYSTPETQTLPSGRPCHHPPPHPRFPFVPCKFPFVKDASFLRRVRRLPRLFSFSFVPGNDFCNTGLTQKTSWSTLCF